MKSRRAALSSRLMPGCRPFPRNVGSFFRVAEERALRRLSDSRSASSMTAVSVLPFAAATFFASASRYGSRRTVVLISTGTYGSVINMSTRACCGRASPGNRVKCLHDMQREGDTEWRVQRKRPPITMKSAVGSSPGAGIPRMWRKPARGEIPASFASTIPASAARARSSRSSGRSSSSGSTGTTWPSSIRAGRAGSRSSSSAPA